MSPMQYKSMQAAGQIPLISSQILGMTNAISDTAQVRSVYYILRLFVLKDVLVVVFLFFFIAIRM